MELGQRIRQIRISRGMTQLDLADGLFDRSYLSHIETCKITPPVQTLQLIAQRLNVPVTELTAELEYTTQMSSGELYLDSARTTRDYKLAQKAWESFKQANAPQKMAESILLWYKLNSKTTEFQNPLSITTRRCSVENDSESYLELLNCEGNSYFQLAMYERAVLVYKEIMDSHPPQEMLNRVRVNLGSALLELHSYSDAYMLYSELLTEMDVSISLLGRIHHGLGICFRSLGRWSDAVKHFETACLLYKDCDPTRYHQCKHNLGVLWLDKLNFAKAYPLLKCSLEFYRSNDMKSDFAGICEELARGKCYEKKYDQAVLWIERGLSALPALPNTNFELSGRLFIWKTYALFTAHQEERAHDCLIFAKSLLGQNFNVLINKIDPNLEYEMKIMADRLTNRDMLDC